MTFDALIASAASLGASDIDLRAGQPLTIEDPIECLHADQRAVISLREIGLDTLSYASGLTSALRQSPDVMRVGEIRDIETIETALIAAETITRIISVSPPHHRPQARLQRPRVLRGIAPASQG